MSSVVEKVENLLHILKEIDLDFNWILALTSLSAQEICVKRTLDSLGEEYSEEDFQKLAENLKTAMESRCLEFPLILLSIARSYRHIRAKVMHTPYKTRLTTAEANAIFNNTAALIESLSEIVSKQNNISVFIDSIDEPSLNQKTNEFSDFEKAIKKQVFGAVLDKISLLDWRELRDYKILFDFLDAVLKIEADIALQGEFFVDLLHRTLTDLTSSNFGLEKLLEIIAKFTRSNHIKELIEKRGLIDSIVTLFESSTSFKSASYSSEIIGNLTYQLSENQIIRVVDAIISNEQITNSFHAKPFLKIFISRCSNKIPQNKREKVLEILES